MKHVHGKAYIVCWCQGNRRHRILLEDDERNLFLGFGYPYNRYLKFYEEYLKPRSGAGLLDLLVIKAVPPLEAAPELVENAAKRRRTA